MIVPSAVDVLRTVEHTIENAVKPSVSGGAELSALATTNHLLRHAALRIENEGQILLDDINALNSLLPLVRAYLATLSNTDATTQANAICLLASTNGLPEDWLRDVYPSLALMAQEAGQLRQQLYSALEYLQGIRSEQSNDKAYTDIRKKINAYIASQIDNETRLIDPAFANQGPRR